ncbi:hypothetical protein PYCCODRAFT_351658 [Trametes coccinea BRFM310]|uniref:Uncharacterized protein n=1 Tax=Trametes coccinea (strain BRFM310) TaxID=1353009 RepID=A0A1Y2J2Z7_TRAC3|nr:hypothetical protein PYCCODRAFT_351658 [Trametes coccinea BRFM310]
MAEDVELVTSYFPVFSAPWPDGADINKPPEATHSSQFCQAGDYRPCSAVHIPSSRQTRNDLAVRRARPEYLQPSFPVCPVAIGVALFQMLICTAPSPEHWCWNAVMVSYLRSGGYSLLRSGGYSLGNLETPRLPIMNRMWERCRSTSLRELYEAHKPFEGPLTLFRGGHALSVLGQ